MAEQDLIKHLNNGFKIFINKNLSFWHKLKNIVLEVLVIVIAITLSIWLNNWNEHKKKQKEVKTFLLGLKEDLQSDIIETNMILETYQEYKLIYTFLSKLDKNKIPNSDSLKWALSQTNSNIYLRPNRSRFDGFLASGKIMNIENDKFTQNILFYYQIVLSELSTSQNGWIGMHNQLGDYLYDNEVDEENCLSNFEPLVTYKFKYLTSTLIPWQQLLERNQEVINKANEIISEINRMYPLNKLELSPR
jgi:hypothetical protein